MVSTTTPAPLAASPKDPRVPVSDAARMRRSVAVGIGRIMAGLVLASRHHGTALPGLAAERVWPDALATLAGQLRATILVVGTNGKTTTAGLIAEILGQGEDRPIANRSGANMRQGITTSLVRASDLKGRVRPGQRGRRDAVFEVDEVALGQILPDLGPCVIVATNLFRDQLDRYGEADAVVELWATALAGAAKGSVLVHCADDPRLSLLASASPLPTRTFGLAGPPTDRGQRASDDDVIADPMTCPMCGRQLTYAWRSIGHLGAFACPEGHVHRASPDVAIEQVATTVDDKAGGYPSRTTLRLTGPLGMAIARPALVGLPNAYNIGAAVAAGTIVGRSIEQGARAIDGYTGAFGRLEWLTIEGRHAVIVLIKNTVSLAETVRLGPSLGADVVLLGLNDAPADGRDVSWIWDAPIRSLVADRHVVLTGSRSADLRLRLKYDGATSAAPPTSIDERSSLGDALDLAVARTPRGGVVVVAATYTAMLGLRGIAQRRGAAPVAPR